MNMLLRTLLRMWRSRRAPRLSMLDVSRIRLRVLPSDLDIVGHMNNGVYFSYMDLGRLDLTVRAGAWDVFRRQGWIAVVESETLTFRRSLAPWQRFELQTRIVGYDEKGVFIEHRFVVDGEIYARGFVRGRFKRKTGGTVPTAELGGELGLDPEDFPVSDVLAGWAREVRMPPSHASFRSEWH